MRPQAETGNRYRLLRESKAASHSPIALRVRSLVSNWAGRPIFFWITVGRSPKLAVDGRIEHRKIPLAALELLARRLPTSRG